MRETGYEAGSTYFQTGPEEGDGVVSGGGVWGRRSSALRALGPGGPSLRHFPFPFPPGPKEAAGRETAIKPLAGG